jgi:signal transduction histidine kinase/ActR/RegA family two-component response regulator
MSSTTSLPSVTRSSEGAARQNSGAATPLVQPARAPSAAPIRQILKRMVLFSSAAALLITTVAFGAYELLTFRQQSIEQLRTLSTAIATNSTAALAFQDPAGAATILAAFKAEPHTRAAALYDARGGLFATYPRTASASHPPPGRLAVQPGRAAYTFGLRDLIGFQPVIQDGERLGTLYVDLDQGALYARGRLYALILLVVIAISLPMAHLLSRRLQQRLSDPILALADSARAVSERHDYSVRAASAGAYEFDEFIAVFNEMLGRIQQSDARLHEQLGRLSLLQQITRATGERQDLPSIFQVVLGSLEQDLPIDFGCLLLYDAPNRSLTVAKVGAASFARAQSLGLLEKTPVPLDQNGLSRCLTGRLVYEPDVREISFPFPERLAAAGLRSVVIAPLVVESEVFGVLVCARCPENAFSSGDCEFLQQLSEHVALASHQARLYGALQEAYDDLRQTQNTIMQQERLRALGQMASGIAHDINNAISPVALYTESLLEREPQLSERARNYLTTIQRAIEDVARTVARMREFYREREAQLTLERVDLNRAVRQVVELTRPRWSDQPQQRGVMVELQTQLTDPLPAIMGAEHEIRDALTNLIFNAVDAMPAGGTLTVRTRTLSTQTGPAGAEGGESLHADGEGDGAAGAARQAGVQYVAVEITDTGVGMDEDTRRRCLEPFYTTKGERGTGLGLAMVYGMVQRHSAEIEIHSEPGRGTTLRLIFPAQAASLVATAPALQPSATARRLRILLVDDDPLLIKSLQETLQEDGHLVTATHGGQAGIDAFAAALRRGERFDLVVTDLGMPHVDGRKVAAAIRTLSPATPIILLTGWGQRLIAENDTPAHVSKVLSKPPRLSELRAAFAELV